MTQEELLDNADIYAWDIMIEHIDQLDIQERYSEEGQEYLQDIYDKAYQEYIDKYSNLVN